MVPIVFPTGLLLGMLARASGGVFAVALIVVLAATWRLTSIRQPR
jgi:hypothetical protein